MKNTVRILLLSVFAFISSEISFAQWVPQNSGTTSLLTHIFFLNEDTGYVSHEQGGMRKTINGGASWTYLNTGGVNIFDFYFFSVDTGVCLSDSGIYRTVNGGTQWNPVVIESPYSLGQNLYCLNGSNLYAVAHVPDSMITYKSTDRGSTWVRNSYYLPAAFDSYIFYTSIDTGYISTGGIIYKTVNGGGVWTNIYYDPDGFLSNYFISGSTGFLLDYFGGLFKTTNGGYNWNQVNTNGNNDLKRSITFTNDSMGFTVGGNGFVPGFVLKTTDAGDNWTLDYTSIQTLEDVCFPSTNVGYACGWGGMIIKYIGDVGFDENDSESLPVVTYPNPTNSILTIQLPSHQFNNSTITIFNSLGDIVFKSEIRNPKSEIDLSKHPKGIYFVKVIVGDRMAVKKIVKM